MANQSPIFQSKNSDAIEHVVSKAIGGVRETAGQLNADPSARDGDLVTQPSKRRLVASADRAPDMANFEAALISFFVESGEMLGVPKSVAAIYGICFASAEPLGFSEIQERLKISAGSISQGLRVLREVGALKIAQPERLKTAKADALKLTGLKEMFEAKRRDRYEPDLELRKLVAHFIEQRLARQLDSGRGILQAISRRIPGDECSCEILKGRLRALQTWHDQALALLPIAKTFLKLG